MSWPGNGLKPGARMELPFILAGAGVVVLTLLAALLRVRRNRLRSAMPRYLMGRSNSRYSRSQSWVDSCGGDSSEWRHDSGPAHHDGGFHSSTNAASFDGGHFGAGDFGGCDGGGGGGGD